MKRFLSLSYGILCYVIFFGTFLYAIGFVGNFVVPKSIDSQPESPLLISIGVDAMLLLVFALQHSIMARPSFKRWWTQFVPAHLERSTYVLLASMCLVLLMWQWQPIGGVIWSVDDELFETILLVLNLTGWFIVLLSTFLINHFDLFGLRQVWLFFTGQSYTSLPFRVPAFYRLVRHPLYLGFLVAFWSTPVMTAAHLLFSFLTTLYILAAIQFEEKDLQDHFGQDYRQYKKKVPMIVPFSKRQERRVKVINLKTSRQKKQYP